MDIVRTFLHAKHWQIFILTFGIPVIFQFAAMGFLFGTTVNSPEPDPMVILNFMKYYPVIMILYVGGLFGWFWSVSMGLQNQLPEGVKMKKTQFKLFFFVPLIYMVVLFSGIVFAVNYFFANPVEPEFGFIFAGFGIVFPLHLFSMFCIFYLMYFAAKTIKSIELGRRATFSDFGGDFFLIWFFVIGIWFIQPRVNKLAATRPDTNKLY